MSLKSIAAKIFAQKIYKKTQAWANSPVETQKAVFLKFDTRPQSKLNLGKTIILTK